MFCVGAGILTQVLEMELQAIVSHKVGTRTKFGTSARGMIECPLPLNHVTSSSDIYFCDCQITLFIYINITNHKSNVFYNVKQESRNSITTILYYRCVYGYSETRCDD